MRYVFAGDREISVQILKFIVLKGYKPLALFVSSDLKQSHAAELIEVANLDTNLVFIGKEVNKESVVNFMHALDLDYIIGIHFPYIISGSLLNVPKIGFLNLHPAYLPYNKGWNTPSWAIIEGEDYGATLHFMAEELDAGDIIYQEKIDVAKSDTANSLYKKVLRKEFEVFEKSFESLLSLNPIKIKQIESGTFHAKKDLKAIQKIDLDKNYTGEELINLLRGLTTNDYREFAYFIEDGVKHRIQVEITTD